LKEKRIEASQWLPTLDFLPGEIKTHRGKQLKSIKWFLFLFYFIFHSFTDIFFFKLK